MNIVIQKKDKYLNQLNEAIKNGNDIFIFTSADWCGHCTAMKPEWAKLKQNNYGPNVVIANVNSEIYKAVHGFGPDVNGFPDLRYINKKKGIVENLGNIDRTYEAIDKMIRSKVGTITAPKHVKGMVYEKPKKSKKNKSKKNKSRKNKSRKRR